MTQTSETGRCRCTAKIGQFAPGELYDYEKVPAGMTGWCYKVFYPDDLDTDPRHPASRACFQMGVQMFPRFFVVES